MVHVTLGFPVYGVFFPLVVCHHIVCIKTLCQIMHNASCGHAYATSGHPTWKGLVCNTTATFRSEAIPTTLLCNTLESNTGCPCIPTQRCVAPALSTTIFWLCCFIYTIQFVSCVDMSEIFSYHTASNL